MTSNLKWWLVILCSVAGLGFAIAHGHIAQIWRIDAYKVCFVTFTTCLIVSVFVWKMAAVGSKLTGCQPHPRGFA